MIKLKGLDFENTYNRSVEFNDDGLLIRTIHKDDLAEAKRSSGRPKDQDDQENLQ